MLKSGGRGLLSFTQRYVSQKSAYDGTVTGVFFQKRIEEMVASCGIELQMICLNLDMNSNVKILDCLGNVRMAVKDNKENG